MSASKIDKVDLKLRIEKHFHDNLHNAEYEIKTIHPRDLLTNNRFDLAFKLLYLEGREYCAESSSCIYNEHIRAFSLGKFTEPGNEDKNSIEKFHASFESTYENIKNNGFDSSLTLIPLTKSGAIANGAHRVASALYLDKEISCVQIDTEEQIYDYKFFYSRNVSIDLLDAAATKFVEYAKNIYIACVWPAAKGSSEQLAKIIPNIVYKKDVTLSHNGAHNLLSQVYYGEEWLGNISNDFKGTKGKLVECFKGANTVRFFAFQAASLSDVLDIKEKVRSLFNIGKHSIHITDTKEEAIQLSRLVFNNNSVHFLNYGKPNVYKDTHKKLEQFKAFAEANGLPKDEVLLDSGMLLAIYGLRKASDLDYLSIDERDIEFSDKNIESHDEELKYHNESKSSLLINPKFHFYFNDIKFIAFNQLLRMKKNRNTTKDINDRLVMEAVIEKNLFKEKLAKVRQSFLYGSLKAKKILLDVFRYLGIYKPVRAFYRLLKSLI